MNVTCHLFFDILTLFYYVSLFLLVIETEVLHSGSLVAVSKVFS